MKRRALSFVAMAACASIWPGCTAKLQTEYVAAVSTQVQVPRDLKTVRFSVSVGGVRQFCRGYRVYDGKVQLPRSLGTFAQSDPSGPITYSIIGYTTDLEEGSEFDDLRCNDSVGTNDARILRRSRQPYIKDKVLFLPLPLKYSCFDKDCPDPGQTCKAGRCADATVDAARLPIFTEDLVDGTGGGCFSRTLCLGVAAPAILVDQNTCTYAIANSASAPKPIAGAPNPFAAFPVGGEGVNVEVVYDGGLNREVLDKDADEGFSIPDAAKPQQFKLAPGLCDMVRGIGSDGKETKHRISALRANGACRAKTTLQPICASDQLEIMGLDGTGAAPGQPPPQACKAIPLAPPKAIMMLTVDDTLKHQSFFDEAANQAVKLGLDDPAFQRTYFGLVYSPGKTGNCATLGSFASDVPPEVTDVVKAKIAASFGARKIAAFVDAPVNLAGALRDTYALLSDPKYSDAGVSGEEGFFRRAVLVLQSRDFAAVCAGAPAPKTPKALAGEALAGPAKIKTYVILLANDPDLPSATTPPQGAVDIAAAGGTGTATDARGTNIAKAKDAFQSIVEALATCVYNVDATVAPQAGDVLSYIDPVRGDVKKIAHAPACSAEGSAANGWGLDPTFSVGGKKRVYVCGQACADYRTILSNASKANAAFGKSSPAIPIFAHKKGCEPK